MCVDNPSVLVRRDSVSRIAGYDKLPFRERYVANIPEKQEYCTMGRPECC